MLNNNVSPSRMRTGIAGLVVSAAALVNVALSEDYVGTAMIPVPGDVPTLGFGETKNVHLGQTTTPTRALVQLLASAEAQASGVRGCVTAPLFQYEFDAYVDLAYNIGTGAFCGSTLVKKLNALDYPGACAEILKWDKFKGQALRGLTKRRQAGYRLCTGAGS